MARHVPEMLLDLHRAAPMMSSLDACDELLPRTAALHYHYHYLMKA
jgi:hypothetical protein